MPRFWADLKSPDFARLDLARSIAQLLVEMDQLPADTLSNKTAF